MFRRCIIPVQRGWHSPLYRWPLVVRCSPMWKLRGICWCISSRYFSFRIHFLYSSRMMMGGKVIDRFWDRLQNMVKYIRKSSDFEFIYLKQHSDISVFLFFPLLYIFSFVIRLELSYPRWSKKILKKTSSIKRCNVIYPHKL